ncbi:hypothetical protein N7509_007424 [Penicillium cosmopolitanum]|uniref:Uncharacterized protein n=1 Tax=Penicillium cosmopolitanum TaxID=1131564 RepID=A0A9W9VYZ0_9EURO|nr:uncharacterized protein N7509_007424 [Penicillium cosmopolitanum]KAJ5391934.1 hypothetical protein N7509_007424 [Penicillium cosmopolitanum]
MFDIVFHFVSYLLHGLFHVLCLFKKRRNVSEKSLLKRLHKPGKILTAPILAQLQSVFKHDRKIWFDDFQFPWHPDRKFGPAKVAELLMKIKEVGDERVIVLVSA